MRVFLALVAAFLVSARVSYNGQQVLRCGFGDPKVIHQLQDVVDVRGVIEVDGKPFVDVRSKNSDELSFIKSITTDCEVAIADLELESQKFEALNLIARNRVDADWFDAYHTYDEIKAWYKALEGANPGLVTFIPTIGQSFQGRDLFAIKIFDRTSNANAQPNGTIYWTGQIHAREWISGATVQYLVNQTLATFKAGDALTKRVLALTQFVVVPLVNPDGYNYTWTTDRQWRKNRRTQTGVACVGVDQNRNYNDHWGQGGSSNQPCSDTYMGPSAASESEVKAVQNYFLDAQKAAPIIGAIDWHSYSQLVLRPYGWTNSICPDETILKQIGDKYAADIKAQSNQTYTSQRSYQLYQTTGSASDWYYGDTASAGNKNFRIASYTIELRPTSANPGFELPPSQIIPTGQENWAAIRNWVNTLTFSPIK